MCHHEAMTEIDASSAEAALRDIAAAHRAAQVPRPTPGWYPPLRAALGAIGFATLYGPWVWRDWSVPLLVSGILCAVAFIAVHGFAVRPGGVHLWPLPREVRSRRLRQQWIGMLCWGLAWLTAIPFGWATGAVVSALVLGGFMYYAGVRENTRIRAGLR
jgi:hypothetical protein